MSTAGTNAGAQDHTELRIGDAIGVLMRRRKLVGGIFAGILLGSVLLTLATAPEYEARASFLILNEKDAVVSLLRSHVYAASVGAATNISGSETNLIQSRVTIDVGSPGAPSTLVVVHARGATSNDAAVLANAYAATLSNWRPFLENVTWDSQWPKFYEQAGKDVERAELQLTEMIAGLEYTRMLDSASPPKTPSDPDWADNLALGAGTGILVSAGAAFATEGVKNSSNRGPQSGKSSEKLSRKDLGEADGE